MNWVQMASKQTEVEFLSYVLQLTPPQDIAVMQGFIYEDSVVTIDRRGQISRVVLERSLG